MQTKLNTHSENPLIWPLLTIIEASQLNCKVHNLASELQLMGLLPSLDTAPNKAVFKRNFLLMNALYQLQDILLPAQWLQIEAMNIQLFTKLPVNVDLILEQNSALRSYYLNWDHFDTSSESIDALFVNFWNRYDHYIGKAECTIERTKALKIFELDSNASKQQICRQWRKLALKWHPDRATGNVVKFREICKAWQTLRA